MADCAASAEYYGPPPPADRDQVRISAKVGGGGFKHPCTTADVESKGVDGADHESAVKIAASIVTTAGTQCEARLQHKANWEKTLVRIRCSDNSWSNWLVTKK